MILTPNSNIRMTKRHVKHFGSSNGVKVHEAQEAQEPVSQGKFVTC